MSTTKYLNVNRTLENLQQEVDPDNYNDIKQFIDETAAEGIGDSQQTRLIYSLKTLIKKFASPQFRLKNATEEELKSIVANVNRSDYAEPTKAKFRAALKKFYKIENGGEHPEKVGFFKVHRNRKPTSVTRDDLFTKEELKNLFNSFQNMRDRAYTMLLYESAARPGELLNCSISDFTTNEKGEFIFLQGLKQTPDRTNQLVRSGRTLQEWIAQHPLGGEMGDIKQPDAPLFVKNEQQACRNCGKIPRYHEDESCTYKPDYSDRMSYSGFRRRFKKACSRAEIPDSKQRPYNLRHTRLTEVATFMGYEQLNKFAGWVPGSNRAKVYVHLNSDDVNKAIRDEFDLEIEEDEEQKLDCPFCNTSNEPEYSTCRNCGRPLSLKKQAEKEEKQEVLERLSELDEQGVLEKLAKLDSSEEGRRVSVNSNDV